MYTALYRALKRAVMRFWMAAYSVARLRGGRTNICNSPLLYGSGDKPIDESSFVKSWMDAQHTVVDLQLLIHG